MIQQALQLVVFGVLIQMTGERFIAPKTEAVCMKSGEATEIVGFGFFPCIGKALVYGGCR